MRHWRRKGQPKLSRRKESALIQGITKFWFHYLANLKKLIPPPPPPSRNRQKTNARSEILWRYRIKIIVMFLFFFRHFVTFWLNQMF